jgi:cobalt-zinc-cadmium efflux system membrane fusion protein
VLTLAASACRRPAAPADTGNEPTVVPVTARAAQVGALRAVIHTTGIVTAAQEAEFVVRPPETARILEITKAEGDQASSGDVLVRFDAGSATANVARQRADLAAAQALAENARISQARTRDFVERGLVARQDLDRADRELADAQSAVVRAQAALATAEAAAARAIVRAPFAGVVANRFRNPGDIASTADAVLRLVDPRGLEVTASVASAEVSRVVPGASARLVGGAAGVIRLTVIGRAGNVDAQTGNAPVRLTFSEPSTVPVDTAVQVDIDAEERVGAVFVPIEALARTGGETAVYVAAGDTARRRTVVIGVETDERIEITSGVSAGELVITRGQTGLEDGAAISAAIER